METAARSLPLVAPDPPDPLLKDRLKAEARARGFTLAGVAPAADADGFGRFAAWLDAGYAGELQYLHDLRDERQHPRAVFAPVRSVLMLGLEYGPPVLPLPSTDTPRGRVAAYARGPDYHRLIWDKLNDLRDWLRAEVPGAAAHGVTDSAPLLERDFARRAGLGWVGKNTMLINTARGSFFFLAALLTNLDLAPDPPQANSHCGTCTACLDACPTAAFPAPGVLDARRCISYLTIELRGAVPEELRPGLGDWVFGCDVCQDVCPWNRRAARGTAGPPAFPADPALATLDPIELLSLNTAQFRKRFEGTSLSRARRVGLLRSAALVLGNVGDERAIPALERAAGGADEVIREAAAWALGQIRARAAGRVDTTA
ncbi:tRNA epoxyqueuosine(34) reductase QueG [Fimbriiglobus ruber]|uniref:Epoxyqueuosine (OQ) reductase QueG n=1 Tax=Fimbriiglobus ruber TaxID=1908690 RepID=A0A225DA77_9BACT|nr:tRNA epoxyqueuosine(34) reductase QueG [Fimbriiglobus ruber]OWK37863.1 Epoxyqueuosine (oQ) reductase QueG [Fimbriiglobus ruber]